MTFKMCDCPEAGLLRTIMSGELPAADTAELQVLGWFIEAVVARKLAGVRSYLEALGEWGGPIGNPYMESHAITSILDCGACGQTTEVKHPITAEQFDALPDTSWVRCPACTRGSA